MRRLPMLGLAGMLLAICSTVAWSHAFLSRAEPRVGATVNQAPAVVALWFSERLEPSFSRVQVLDASGQRVDKNDSSVDPADTKKLQVSMKPLGPGTYKVVWRAVSVDAHVTEGNHVFHIVP